MSVGRGPKARVEAFDVGTVRRLRRFEAPEEASRDFGGRIAACGSSLLVEDGIGRRVHVYDRESGRRTSALDSLIRMTSASHGVRPARCGG